MNIGTPRLIKILRNSQKVLFDSGKFDNWCVFIADSNGFRKAPSDVEYFTRLKSLSQPYTPQKIYADFVLLYNKTTREIDPDVLRLIDIIANTYHENHRAEMEKWLTVLYAGMVAEENKEKAILKKRIKRLGLHQVLIDNLEPEKAANFSRGKYWKELDEMMKQKGF